MDMLKNYLPVLVSLALQLGVFLLCNRGVITEDQAMMLMGTLGTVAPLVTLRMQPPSKGGGGGSAAVLFLLAFSTETVITGCAGSFEENSGIVRVGGSPDVASRCAELDDRHAIAGGIGKGAAVGAGAAGLATIPAKDKPDLQTGLAIGSVGLGVVSAGALFISDAASTSWARECSAAPVQR